MKQDTKLLLTNSRLGLAEYIGLVDFTITSCEHGGAEFEITAKTFIPSLCGRETQQSENILKMLGLG